MDGLNKIRVMTITAGVFFILFVENEDSEFYFSNLQLKIKRAQ